MFRSVKWESPQMKRLLLLRIDSIILSIFDFEPCLVQTALNIFKEARTETKEYKDLSEVILHQQNKRKENNKINTLNRNTRALLTAIIQRVTKEYSNHNRLVGVLNRTRFKCFVEKETNKPTRKESNQWFISRTQDPSRITNGNCFVPNAGRMENSVKKS